MKLPARCPHLRSAKDWSSVEEGETQCCRTDNCNVPVFVRKQGPLCRDVKYKIEEYRLLWRSSFDGGLMVHVGRGEKSITLEWAYSGPQGDGHFWKSIDRDGWAQLESALLAAGFWAINPEEERQGIVLDGALWTIEGRRRDVYRVIHRHSPRGPIHDLGRALLDIAGPPIASVKLY